MRIHLDEDRCEAYGLCEHAAPELFELDDEGRLTLLQPDVPAELIEKGEEGVNLCPVSALTIEQKEQK